MFGLIDLVVVGGMESMLNIFYYVFKVWFGYKFGDGVLIDGLSCDGLKDVYDYNVMGVCVDVIVEKYSILREE